MFFLFLGLFEMIEMLLWRTKNHGCSLEFECELLRVDRRVAVEGGKHYGLAIRFTFAEFKKDIGIVWDTGTVQTEYKYFRFNF